MSAKRMYARVGLSIQSAPPRQTKTMEELFPAPDRFINYRYAFIMTVSWMVQNIKKWQYPKSENIKNREIAYFLWAIYTVFYGWNCISLVVHPNFFRPASYRSAASMVYVKPFSVVLCSIFQLLSKITRATNRPVNDRDREFLYQKLTTVGRFSG